MEAMICKNCGGHINPRTYKCDYCDTQYKRDNDPNIIRVENLPFETEEIICGLEIPPHVA